MRFRLWNIKYLDGQWKPWPQLMAVQRMIRNATINDIPAIKSLMKSEPGFWNDSWRENAIDTCLESSKGLSFVWTENEKIYGFVSAHDVGVRAYLSELIVSAEKRGIGIGSALIQEVEEKLIIKGCKILISDVWKDAIGFYQSVGFSEPVAVKFLFKKL